MGSKKHKKHHRSEKKDNGTEERAEKPLKLVLKVGGNSSSVQTPVPPQPAASSGCTQLQDLEPLSSLPELEEAMDESPQDSNAYSEKHKKSKKKKKKKSSEKEKEKHDKKRKHHHHHHHREHGHETPEVKKQEKKKRDHDAIHDGLDGREHEPPSKLQHLDHLAPCERPLRDPRTCTLKRKAMKSPLQLLLYYLLKNLQKKDPQQFFAWPVSDIIAPGYSSIISNPMDFSTMKKKIDDKDYTNVAEFKTDLKLMCDNAMLYNRSDTVYYKGARKLWHIGEKILSRDQLLLLKRNLPYISELGAKELGFDPDEENDENYVKEEIVSDSGSLALQDPKKTKLKSSWNQIQEDTDSQDDEMSPEEILAEARKAAEAAADKLTLCCPKSKFGFLRQHENGSTTLALVNPSNGGLPGQQRELKVNLEMLAGKLNQGTGSITRFREDAKNIVKPVNYLSYGQYTSYSPQYDSMFANLTKEESDLVLSAYGDEMGIQYAESIMSFAKDCDYVMTMVDNLLDIITGGEHSKTMKLLEERRKCAEEEKKKPDDLTALVTETLSTERKERHQEDPVLLEQRLAIQQKLDSTTKLLQDLAKVQHDRLSAEPPPHLAHIQGPSAVEQELAEKVTQKLADIAAQATPSDVISVECLRKAMGITFQPVSEDSVGLLSNQPSVSSSLDQTTTTTTTATAATVVEVNGESESGGRYRNLTGERQGLASTSPAQLTSDDQLQTTDLESELREFLETGPMLRVCESPSVT